MRYLSFILFVFPILYFNHADGQRKIISDSQYKYTFYVSDKNVNGYIDSKAYYWYKSGEIHSSYGGSDGHLLDGKYTKSDKQNNISEQGIFKTGLKDSIWKEWHPNGQLKSITKWKKGIKSGLAFIYNENGGIIEKGKFKNNKKQGVWINEESKDTLYFKHGEKIEKKEKKKLTEKLKLFFNKLFSRNGEIEPIPQKKGKQKIKKDKSTPKEKTKSS